jgi:hypothetical protein
MQSAKVKVQQTALMSVLKSQEPISIPILYFAICNLQLIAQNPQVIEQLLRNYHQPCCRIEALRQVVPIQFHNGSMSIYAKYLRSVDRLVGY